jgi:hypothetical protein
VHHEVGPLGDAGRGESQLGRRVAAGVDLSQRGDERPPSGEVRVVRAGVGDQEVLQQPPGVAGGGFVEHRQGHGTVGRAHGDDVGDARRARGGEPGGLARAGMTDEQLARAEAGEGVHHPGEAGALAERAVRVARGQAAGVAGAQRDEPLAAVGRRHAERLRCPVRGGEVDDALGRRVGEQACGGRRQPDVQGHGRFVVEEALEVERVGELADGEVFEGDDEHAGGRVQRRDDASVTAAPSGDDAIQAGSEVTVPDEVRHVRHDPGLGFEPRHQGVGGESGIARSPPDELLAGLREHGLGAIGREPDRQRRAGTVGGDRELEGALGRAVTGELADQRTVAGEEVGEERERVGAELTERRHQPRSEERRRIRAVADEPGERQPGRVASAAPAEQAHDRRQPRWGQRSEHPDQRLHGGEHRVVDAVAGR